MNRRSNQWSGWDQGSRIPFNISQSSSLTTPSGRGDWQQLNNRFPFPSFQPPSDARSSAIRQFEERTMERFPSELHRTMQIVLFDSMARETRPRIGPFLQHNNVLNYQPMEDLEKLEHQKAMEKLKKVIYGSDPKTLTRRLSLFYNGVGGSNNATWKGNNTDLNEDSKRCAICLDDFEVGTEVMLTPCNHMFHEDCMLPWMKSNGQCPVCRFVIYEPRKGNAMAFNGRSIPPLQPLYGDLFINEEMNSSIRPRYSSSSWDMFLSSF